MLDDALNIRRDPLGFLETTSRDKRDVVPIRLGYETLYLLNHPDHIRRVFVENEKNFVKGRYYRRIQPFTGNGIFTQEGIEWSRQRHIAQPFFAGHTLTGFSDVIAKAGRSAIDALQRQHGTDGVQSHDLLTFFSAITLAIAIECFTGPRIDFQYAARLAGALTRILRQLERRLWLSLPLPVWVPTASNKQFHRDVQLFYDFINDQITERLRGGGRKPGQLLIDAIMAAEGLTHESRGFHKSVSEQILSVVLAAFETGALALVWSTTLLKRHPQTEARLIEEAKRVLHSADITSETVAALAQSRNVFLESLRLYPPAWCFSRELLEADKFGDTQIGRGKTIIISPYIFHRNPNLWEKPLEFDPDRFNPERTQDRHKYAFFPFAGGRHACLGARFAMIEGPLVLSLLLKSFKLDIDLRKDIHPVAATTLRPGVAIPMKISPR